VKNKPKTADPHWMTVPWKGKPRQPRLAPRRGACPGWPQSGGVAGAQPPANGWHASGV